MDGETKAKSSLPPGASAYLYSTFTHSLVRSFHSLSKYVFNAHEVPGTEQDMETQRGAGATVPAQSCVRAGLPVSLLPPPSPSRHGSMTGPGCRCGNVPGDTLGTWARVTSRRSQMMEL